MNSSGQTVSVIAGVVVGAAVGGAFGWLASSRSKEGNKPSIATLSPAQYFQLGIGVLTLARQFGSMIQKSEEI